MTEREYQHKGYRVEARSYEVLAGPNNPAGWVPHISIWWDQGGTVTVQPLTHKTKIVATREEADQVALQMARVWIDEKG